MKITAFKIIISVFFVVLILMVLFPPYAVMKMDSDTITKHAFVGYHPIWNPPTQIFAYEFLEEKPFVKNDSPGFAVQLSSYLVIFNKVRFITNMIILIFVTSALLLIFRQRKQRRKLFTKGDIMKIFNVSLVMFLSISLVSQCEEHNKKVPIGPIQPIEAKEATVWFLGHCGFAVQTSNHFLIFDYVEKQLENSYPKPDTRHLATGYINPEEIKNLKVRIFITHEHSDHFDPVIFEWEKHIPDIQYFFGWQASNESQYHYLLAPRAEWKTDDLEIFTINSHHSGVPEVAYLVRVDSLVIYHNGDYRGNYQEDIAYLKSEADSIDLAFTSCVWEQQWEYYRINLELISQFQPNAVFPMHVRVGDEEQYFIPFRDTYQSHLQDGQIILSNNKKGAKYFYKNGIIIPE